MQPCWKMVCWLLNNPPLKPYWRAAQKFKTELIVWLGETDSAAHGLDQRPLFIP